MTIAASPNTYIVIKALQGSFESVYSSEIVAPDIPSWATQLGLTTAAGTNNYTMNAKGNDLCKVSVRALDGSIYCAGSTTGSLGEPNGGGKDAIIVKFNPDTSVAWIRQLGALTKSTTGNNIGSEECTGLALSTDLLSVYCAGQTTGNMSETNGGGQDAFIAKIASDGTITWATQLGLTNGNDFSKGNSTGDDTCNSVVVDAAENIYCAGTTTSTTGNDQNAFVVKLLPTGAVDWLTEINNTTNPTGADHLRDDICYSVVTDGTSVFCAGATNGNMATIIRTSTDLDIFMFSLNALTGNLDWIKQKYEASQEDDYCLSLALNSSTTPNQLYCGGKTLSDLDGTNNGGFDAFVMSINATNGAELTITQIGSIADDACLSIATNGGYVVCGGETSGNLTEVNGGLTDTFVSVFTSGLAHILTNQLGSTSPSNTSQSESCQGISISDGLPPYTINCVGETTGELGDTNSGSGFSSDIFIQQLEFDTTFPTLFQNTINQIGSSFSQNIIANRALASESCKSITKDSSGNTYCAGHTYGSLFETNAGGADAVVMKFDATGSLVWSVQLGEDTTSDPSFDLEMDADASGDEFCRSIALDSNGNVYCSGYTSGGLKEPNGGGNDIFIMKLTEDGIITWVKHFGNDTPILSGNNSGDDKCHAITIVSAADDIICVGETTGFIGEVNAGGSDAFAIKLDTDGDPVWANQIGLTSTVTAVTPDKSKDDVFYAVTQDNSGFIYAAGSTKGSLFDDNLNTNQDILIAKFDISDGSRGWSTQGGPTTFLTGSTAGNDVCYGLAINSDKTSIYCGGSSDGALGDDNAGTIDAVVMSFNSSSGSRNWITHLGVQNLLLLGSGSNSGSDECLSIAVDGSDKIYCGGKTDGNLGENNGGISTTDAFIAKIDSTGILGDIFQLGDTTIDSGPNSGNETCESILITDTESPVCGGYTFGSPGENNGSSGDGISSDIYIFKLDSSGTF
jgi:hypothetical protein